MREGGRGKGEEGRGGAAPPPGFLSSTTSLPPSPFPLPAIRMDGIEKTFGDCVALRGASLEVIPGEIHALVGENGAGKSTLMKVLGGLIKPDAGRVEIDGRDVTGCPRATPSPRELESSIS